MFLVPLQSHALTASEVFVDGNRLFRDDLYWAALLRYRQAYEAGMDTPLLHYNTGVAHFKAEQHIRARTALLKAVQDPGLRVISQYNLGLNAYAAGNVDEALNWFRQARDQEQSSEIRRLAIIAISRLQSERIENDELLVRVEKRKVEPKFTDFDLKAFVGFGTDDNVYRTPGQDYVDFADPALPLVTPEVVSGAFVPIDMQLKYSINSLEFESFYAASRVAGRIYQDEELDNADEYSHELSFGSSYRRKDMSISCSRHTPSTSLRKALCCGSPWTGTAGATEIGPRSIWTAPTLLPTRPCDTTISRWASRRDNASRRTSGSASTSSLPIARTIISAITITGVTKLALISAGHRARAFGSRYPAITTTTITPTHLLFTIP
ncbi:MAG: tetratricopeptide repeat protein [Proteobacteria bacterium]|nr:tetratricopeptide repeat protein [Pseudomonadota bacterium]